MPCQAFTRKTKTIVTSSWQSDCLSPQAFCHLAGHVLGSAKSAALQRRENHANCGPPASSASRQDAPRTTAGSPADPRRREFASRLSPISAAIVCAEINAIPRPAITACLIVSLDPISMPMRGSMPCCSRNRTANKRVPEPTSRIRIGLLGDLSRRDTTLLGQRVIRRSDDDLGMVADHRAFDLDAFRPADHG
jgi:hypothetical protein